MWETVLIISLGVAWGNILSTLLIKIFPTYLLPRMERMETVRIRDTHDLDKFLDKIRNETYKEDDQED
jgi:hypothetical protein